MNIARLGRAVALSVCALAAGGAAAAAEVTAPMVDTGQGRAYDERSEIRLPRPGQAFYGQDANYRGNAPSYRDNGDGTVTDQVTGLMWSQAVDPRKVTPEQAQALARQMTLGGYSDWRVPNIKELYSLIDFNGNAGMPQRRGFSGGVPADAVPFIDTDHFGFRYGDTRAGERYIDAQWLSSTHYVSTTMGGKETVFGVNFADGRIKGYGYRDRHRVLLDFYVRYVRGSAYGHNDFVDNGDGTVSDRATGLMWSRDDSGRAMTWREALAYAEAAEVAGYDDWRLPNAKELQYIVDYTRSPDSSGSAAIDPLFATTAIDNEAGQTDYPSFWTSTTHLDGPRPAANAVYVAFGRALGALHGRVLDVHGAGAQRSDPKVGRAYLGHGPQGDAVRSRHFVRLVRGGAVQATSSAYVAERAGYPSVVRVEGGTATRVTTPRPATRSGFVAHLDRDGDGRVSRAEFDGPPDRFDYHDRNGDGYLSDAEAPPPGAGPQPWFPSNLSPTATRR